MVNNYAGHFLVQDIMCDYTGKVSLKELTSIWTRKMSDAAAGANATAPATTAADAAPTAVA